METPGSKSKRDPPMPIRKLKILSPKVKGIAQYKLENYKENLSQKLKGFPQYQLENSGAPRRSPVSKFVLF